MRTPAPQEYNDKIRNELNNHISEYGTTNKFIAAKVGLDNSTIGKFRKGIFNLSLENLRNIETYLSNYR